MERLRVAGLTGMGRNIVLDAELVKDFQQENVKVQQKNSCRMIHETRVNKQ